MIPMAQLSAMVTEAVQRELEETTVIRDTLCDVLGLTPAGPTSSKSGGRHNSEGRPESAGVPPDVGIEVRLRRPVASDDDQHRGQRTVQDDDDKDAESGNNRSHSHIDGDDAAAHSSDDIVWVKMTRAQLQSLIQYEIRHALGDVTPRSSRSNSGHDESVLRERPTHAVASASSPGRGFGNKLRSKASQRLSLKRTSVYKEGNSGGSTGEATLSAATAASPPSPKSASSAAFALLGSSPLQQRDALLPTGMPSAMPSISLHVPPYPDALPCLISCVRAPDSANVVHATVGMPALKQIPVRLATNVPVSVLVAELARHLRIPHPEYYTLWWSPVGAMVADESVALTVHAGAMRRDVSPIMAPHQHHFMRWQEVFHAEGVTEGSSTSPRGTESTTAVELERLRQHWTRHDLAGTLDVPVVNQPFAPPECGDRYGREEQRAVPSLASAKRRSSAAAALLTSSFTEMHSGGSSGSESHAGDDGTGGGTGGGGASDSRLSRLSDAHDAMKSASSPSVGSQASNIVTGNNHHNSNSSSTLDGGHAFGLSGDEGLISVGGGVGGVGGVGGGSSGAGAGGNMGYMEETSTGAGSGLLNARCLFDEETLGEFMVAEGRMLMADEDFKSTVENRSTHPWKTAWMNTTHAQDLLATKAFLRGNGVLLKSADGLAVDKSSLEGRREGQVVLVADGVVELTLRLKPSVEVAFAAALTEVIGSTMDGTADVFDRHNAHAAVASTTLVNSSSGGGGSGGGNSSSSSGASFLSHPNSSSGGGKSDGRRVVTAIGENGAKAFGLSWAPLATSSLPGTHIGTRNRVRRKPVGGTSVDDMIEAAKLQAQLLQTAGAGEETTTDNNSNNNSNSISSSSLNTMNRNGAKSNKHHHRRHHATEEENGGEPQPVVAGSVVRRRRRRRNELDNHEHGESRDAAAAAADTAAARPSGLARSVSSGLLRHPSEDSKGSRTAGKRATAQFVKPLADLNDVLRDASHIPAAPDTHRRRRRRANSIDEPRR